METPTTFERETTEGLFVEPGNAEDSFLFQVASHLEDPVMPPAKNKVDAKNLTPHELGLLKLWIDQGAKEPCVRGCPLPGDSTGIPTLPFMPVRSIGSRVAAAGRGNRIHLYDLATGRSLEPRGSFPCEIRVLRQGRCRPSGRVNSLAFSLTEKPRLGWVPRDQALEKNARFPQARSENSGSLR